MQRDNSTPIEQHNASILLDIYSYIYNEHSLFRVHEFSNFL